MNSIILYLVIAMTFEVLIIVALLIIASKKKKKEAPYYTQEVKPVRQKIVSKKEEKKETHFFRKFFSKVGRVAAYPFVMLARGIKKARISHQERKEMREKERKIREAREERERAKREEQERLKQEIINEERRQEELHKAKLALLEEKRIQIQRQRESEEEERKLRLEAIRARAEKRRKEEKIEASEEEPSKPINWLMLLAFAIPIVIFLFFLYLNFLPFGYQKSYTITLDENNSESKTSLFFTSKVVLRDAKANITIINSTSKEIIYSNEEKISGREFNFSIPETKSNSIIKVNIFQKPKWTMTSYIGP